MQPTTVTNKNVANGIPAKKRPGKPGDDGPDPGTPVELQGLLQALRAMRAGDFSVRMAGEDEGLLGKIADTFNDIVAANQRMAEQIERVGELVGREGQTRHRVKFSLDAWNSNSKEPHNERAHVKATASWNLSKLIFVNGGMDNILNVDRRHAFIGAGLTFTDDDMKYLMGSVPVPR